ADGWNSGFINPMMPSEVRNIAKSVAKWVWAHFTVEDFSDRQQYRALRRWRGHVAASKAQPWAAMGIDRATYYRRQKAGILQAGSKPPQPASAPKPWEALGISRSVYYRRKKRGLIDPLRQLP